MSSCYCDLAKNLVIPQLHKDVIVGCGLGDAGFSITSENKAVMRFGQGLPNKSYLYYLFDIMKQYASQPQVKEQTVYDPRYDKTNLSYGFTTKASSIFYPFAQLFLDKTEKTKKTIKIVPSCLYELLSPGALAFWLQDDGQHVKRGGITLCTDNYSYDEVLILKLILEDKYKLQCTIHNKNIAKGYYRIYISAKSLPILQSLVVEYFHGSMLYKLNLKNT